MRQTKGIFAVFLCLALAWTSWLAYMAFTVADPIVVSAPQVHLASLVVVGKVTIEGASAKVKVVKIYKDDAQQRRQNPLPDLLTVPWLASYPRSADQSYLLPLVPELGQPGRYDVAPVYQQQANMNMLQPVSIVYPMTESVRIQVEKILGVK